MKKLRAERGSATVELTFVFPIILFILIIMMFFGLFMYEQVAAQAVLDDVVSSAAANWATLESGVYAEKPSSQDFSVWDIYSRIIDFVGDSRERVIEEEALRRLRAIGLFSNTFEEKDVELKCTNVVVYKTLDLTVNRTYELPFPGFLEMMGIPTELHYKLTATAVVQDQAELIRTIDIAGDMLKQNAFFRGLYAKAQEAMSSMSKFFSSFSLEG